MSDVPCPRQALEAESQLPLATFTVFAYNQVDFVRESVRAAFAQTYRPLQVILSDDASTDGTFEAMQQEASACPSDIQLLLNRNAENIGIAEHINKVIGLSDGKYVVLSAGDDVSLPQRTARSVDAILHDPKGRKLAFSAVNNMSASGQFMRVRGNPHLRHMESPMAVLENDVYHTGSSVAVDRCLYADFPPLHPNVVNEDKVSAFRASFFGGAIYIDEPLVNYREGVGVASMHGATLSGRDDPAREATYMQTMMRRRLWLLSQLQLDIQSKVLTGRVTQELRTKIDRMASSTARIVRFIERPTLAGVPALIAAAGMNRKTAKIAVLTLTPEVFRRYKQLRNGRGSTFGQEV